MKKSLVSIALIATNFLFGQVKLYNVDLPYFNKAKLVKPAKALNYTNPLTKKITQISEYNSIGQLHGVSIGFRGDKSVSFINYYHNGKIVYSALPFINGSTIQRVYNYNDNGSYDGTQAYTFLNTDTNKWIKTTFDFSNGRLTTFIDNKLQLPQYTLNFKEGKLNGEFYFYDDLYCTCYYYGKAQDGKIQKIMRINIENDLSFENRFYIIDENSIKYGVINDSENSKEGEIAIKQIPIIVQNKEVQINTGESRIIFNKQHDWLSILKEKSINPAYNTDDLNQDIDLSDTMYGAPAPYTIPKTQH